MECFQSVQAKVKQRACTLPPRHYKVPIPRWPPTWQVRRPRTATVAALRPGCVHGGPPPSSCGLRSPWRDPRWPGGPYLFGILVPGECCCCCCGGFFNPIAIAGSAPRPSPPASRRRIGFQEPPSRSFSWVLLLWRWPLFFASRLLVPFPLAFLLLGFGNSGGFSHSCR